MKFGTVVAGVAMALGMSLTAGAASAADIIHTYDFNGTLANSYNGLDAVSGQFTLDQTTGALTDVDIDTPTGISLSSGGGASQFTASSPAANFVELHIVVPEGLFSDADYYLFFETNLSHFAGNTFYTGEVDGPDGGELLTGAQCDFTACRPPYFSNFTSGEAKLAGVPEPATWGLMLFGAAGLGGALRARRKVANAIA